jgi:alkyl hydroperoxide reductase subunit F
MYGAIVIGAGPAGITAAVYTARKKMKTLVISKNIGGQAALSGEIENYTGFQFITGPELAKKFEEHIKKFDVELKENEEVISVEKKNKSIKVKTNKGEYETLTLIIAAGSKPRMLGIPGEKEFKNKGVTYCATCDAPLFSGKNVAVIGGGNSGLESALQLNAIAKKVYLINLTEKLTGDKVLIEKVKKSDKIKIMNNTETKEILGDKFANKLKVKTKEGDKILDVEGVFIEIGWVPVSIPVSEGKKKIKLDKWKEIEVNAKAETNIPGIFAAGDISSIPYKQIIAAAGQGCIASLSAFRYYVEHSKGE